MSQINRRETLGLLAAGPAALGALAGVGAGRRRRRRPPILMPIGDATEAVDTLYPFFRVAEDGYRAVIAGPEARMYHMVLHEVPPVGQGPLGHHRGAAGLSHPGRGRLPRRRPDEVRRPLRLRRPRSRVPPVRQGPAADHAPLLRGEQAGGRRLPRHRDRQRRRSDPRPHRHHRREVRPRRRARGGQVRRPAGGRRRQPRHRADLARLRAHS